MLAWFWLGEVSVICRLPRVCRQSSYTDDGCGDGLNANESLRVNDGDDYKAARWLDTARAGTAVPSLPFHRQWGSS